VLILVLKIFTDAEEKEYLSLFPCYFATVNAGIAFDPFSRSNPTEDG
jgi:hypothetical protein